MPGAALLADGLHALEQVGVNGRRKAGRSLLLVGPTLVADDPTGVERVDEDLRDARLGQSQHIRERHVAPGARGVQAEGPTDALEVRPLDGLQQLLRPRA